MVVIVRAMAVMMQMALLARVRAAQRAEPCAHVGDTGAEPFEHRLEDVIAQDQDAVGMDGCGEMAVADVPGELGEMHRVARPDLEQLFLCSNDAGTASVVEEERVAVRQHERFGKVDKDSFAAAQDEDAAAQMALVMLEHRDVERRRGLRVDLSGTFDRYDTQHRFISLELFKPEQ
jgi:hypothetical protein